jgi:CRP-like cAMP-binding protein
MVGVSIVGDTQQQLSFDFWQSLKDLATERVHSGGVRLFDLGQRCDGVYLVQEGEVTLTLPGPKASPRLEVARAGALLGLSEAVTGGRLRLRAETSTCTHVAFVERSQLLGLLRERPEFCMQVVKLLSEDLHVLYYKVRQHGRRAFSGAKRADAS